jgi:peptide/nickel transport system substrate-binding protein
MRAGSWRRQALVGGLALALALLLAACSGGSDNDNSGAADTSSSTSGGTAGGASAPSSKTLVIARGMDVNSLDPSRSYCDTCQIYNSAVYQTVIGLDPNDNKTLIPRLAAKWIGNSDSTEWTFNLDPAAKFSDGSPVTSEDVKWSWERLGNIKGSPSYFVDNVASIDATDPRTVVVKMKGPDSSFLAVTTAPYMVITNSKVATAQGAQSGPGADQSDKAEQWFLSHSAGSGPYTLADYKEGAELRLTRNEAFWGTKPYFKDIIIKETPEAVVQRQSLETGDADIAMQINPDLAKQMKGGNITIQDVPSFNYVYIYLWPGTPLGKDIKLEDQRVRQAIRAAIDYKGMIDNTVGGSGRMQSSAIPNGFDGTKNVAPPAQNLDEAKQLLRDAGYPNGFTIPAYFVALNVYGVDFSSMFQKLKIDLARVGINLDLQPVTSSVAADLRSKGGYPLSASYFAPDHTDPIQYAQFFGMIKGSFYNNRLKVPTNPAEEQATADALKTVDPEKRTQLFETIAKEMVKDAYIIPLVNPNLILAYRSGITGMHYSACCNLELFRLAEK